MKSLLCYLSLISAHTLSSLHCLLTMTPLRLHNQISSQYCSSSYTSLLEDVYSVQYFPIIIIVLETIIGWKSDLFPIFHIRPGEPCGQRNTISKIKTGFRKPDRDQRSGSENVLSLNKNCVGRNSKEILLI